MKLNNILYSLFFVILATSCGIERPPSISPSENYPEIFPDYIGVTIPAQIAPMNFNVGNDEDVYVYVEVTGSNGDKIETAGKWADFDEKSWHRLTSNNVGGSLTFDVSVKDDHGTWTRFKPFEMYVSDNPLDDYGLVYRRIAPGYETYSKIGIYQRNLSTFDESPILEESAVDGQCLNCHYSNRTDPSQFTLHVRGAHGATILADGDNVRCLNTKADGMKGSCTYGYWHPDGRYIAFSLNRIYQNFYVSKDKLIEPWDEISDLVVLDTQTDQLITTEKLTDEDFQTAPAFSPDGKTIYFCYAPNVNMPKDYAKLKYSLCSVQFDAATATLSDSIITIINGDSIDKSVNVPRPSYDGKYIMYCLTDYGTTPAHRRDADLYLLDLSTGQSREMKELNSTESDGYHNWSSNSKWFMFGSKRLDAMCSLPYLSSIGDDGIATKPFLLPQKNPKKYYQENMHSFNAPDFTSKKVDLDPIKARRMVMTDDKTKVTVR